MAPCLRSCRALRRAQDELPIFDRQSRHAGAAGGVSTSLDTNGGGALNLNKRAGQPRGNFLHIRGFDWLTTFGYIARTPQHAPVGPIDEGVRPLCPAWR